MTLARIRTFLEKFDGQSHPPSSVKMLKYVLKLLDSDSDDRVQALLMDLLEAEKHFKEREIELGEWMTSELEKKAAKEGDLEHGNDSSIKSQHDGRQRRSTPFG